MESGGDALALAGTECRAHARKRTLGMGWPRKHTATVPRHPGPNSDCPFLGRDLAGTQTLGAPSKGQYREPRALGQLILGLSEEGFSLGGLGSLGLTFFFCDKSTSLHME